MLQLIKIYPGRIYFKLKDSRFKTARHIEELSLTELNSNNSEILKGLGIKINGRFRTFEVPLDSQLNVYKLNNQKFDNQLISLYSQQLPSHNNLPMYIFEQQIYGTWNKRKNIRETKGLSFSDISKNKIDLNTRLTQYRKDLNLPINLNEYNRCMRVKTNKISKQAVNKIEKQFKNEAINNQIEQYEPTAKLVRLTCKKLQILLNSGDIGNLQNYSKQSYNGENIELEQQHRAIYEALIRDQVISKEDWLTSSMHVYLRKYTDNIVEINDNNLKTVYEHILNFFKCLMKAQKKVFKRIKLMSNHRIYQSYIKIDSDTDIIDALIQDKDLRVTETKQVSTNDILKQLYKIIQPFKDGDILINNGNYYLVKNETIHICKDDYMYQNFGFYIKPGNTDKIYYITNGSDIKIPIDSQEDSYVTILRLKGNSNTTKNIIKCEYVYTANSIEQPQDGFQTRRVEESLLQKQKLSLSPLLRKAKDLIKLGMPANDVMTILDMLQSVPKIYFTQHSNSDTKFFDFIEVDISLNPNQELIGGQYYDMLNKLKAYIDIIDKVVIRCIQMQGRWRQSNMKIQYFQYNRVLTRDNRLVYKFSFKDQFWSLVGA